LQIVCDKGVLVLHPDRSPVAHLGPGNPFEPTREPRPWIPITTAGIDKPEPLPDKTAAVRNHVAAVRDLIAAVDEKRPPLCDALAGRTSVEMVCGVFESHLRNGEDVTFPLQLRDNALSRL
ncbi:MAG: gfo/Idh/MocA family oxidoreductase, partial [Verrucomicrobiae bacterium]|nr:gfo/Idh/MocA family oxidoreductase [Verrucomicrobiae bacterium]